MGSKKINLKASINKINTKANAAKKKKQSTKLKLILADPYKYLVPTLPPPKATELCDLVQSEITSNASTGKDFAKQFGVSLGMSSSLRVIGSCSASCVLISKSIKPKFIIQQIACFSKQRNSKAPVFAVDDLEELSKKMFGVNSAVVAFGNSTPSKVADWIASQRSEDSKKSAVPVGTQDSSESTTKSSLSQISPPKSVLLRKEDNGKRAFVPANVVKYKHQVIDHRMKFSGDFVSFGSQSFHPKQNLPDTDEELDEGEGTMLNKLSIKLDKEEQPKASKRPKVAYREYDKEKDFPKSYAKFKTLALLSGKNPNKKKKT